MNPSPPMMQEVGRHASTISIGHVVAACLAVVLFAGCAAWYLHQPTAAQGVAIQREVSQVIDAMRRAKLDANCFPVRLDALVEAKHGQLSDCGNDLRERLRGPYLQAVTFDDAGALLLRASAEQGRLQLVAGESQNHPELLLSGVHFDLALQIVRGAQQSGQVVRFAGNTGQRAAVNIFWRL